MPIPAPLVHRGIQMALMIIFTILMDMVEIFITLFFIRLINLI